MRYSSQYNSLTLDLFKSSFDGLRKNNPWVFLGENIPWAEVEKTYHFPFSNKYKGVGNHPVRMIIVASIIKHKLSLSELPAAFYADKNYRNKANWLYQKDEEIKLYCKPLGHL